MIKAKKGHIISTASMASYTTCAGMVDYCVSKAAAMAFTDGMCSHVLLFPSSGQSTSLEAIRRTSMVGKRWKSAEQRVRNFQGEGSPEMSSSKFHSE
jgi:NADP-dependent 3-hydroxy acid dehydrogenase YdfG